MLFRPRDRYGRLERSRPGRRRRGPPAVPARVPDEALALARAQWHRGRRIPGDFVSAWWSNKRRWQPSQGWTDAEILAMWAEYLERA